jgi:hypothetical protein
MQNWIEPQSACALDRQSYVERNVWRHQRNHFGRSFSGSDVADLLSRQARRFSQSFARRAITFESAGVENVLTGNSFFRGFFAAHTAER